MEILKTINSRISIWLACTPRKSAAHLPKFPKLSGKKLAIFVWYRSDRGGGLHENIRDSITYARHILEEIIVICPRSTFAKKFEESGARVIEVNYDDLSLDELCDRLGMVDLVHLHPGKSRQTGMEYARIRNIPTVKTIHGKWFDGIEKNHTNINHVISVSRYIEEQIRRSTPELRSRLSTIENGVDLAFFPQAQSFGRHGEYIICCSRLDKDKPGLIEALPMLWRLQAQRGLKIPWLLVGDGPLRQHLQDTAKETFRTEDTVRFSGWRQKNELADLYRNAFISVSPGRSALESMACGVPTISCGSSGGLRIIDSFGAFEDIAYSNFGGFGSDYKPDSMERCMEFIEQAYEGRLDSGFFQGELMLKVRQDFDAQRMTTELLKVYARVCN